MKYIEWEYSGDNINVRDVLPRFFPVYVSPTGIVSLFANAHEITTPQELYLEKEMDLFNNDVGITYCWNCVPGISTDNAIRDAIMIKLNNGELKYLTPLDATSHIIDSLTQLIPTNQ